MASHGFRPTCVFKPTALSVRSQHPLLPAHTTQSSSLPVTTRLGEGCLGRGLQYGGALCQAPAAKWHVLFTAPSVLLLVLGKEMRPSCPPTQVAASASTNRFQVTLSPAGPRLPHPPPLPVSAQNPPPHPALVPASGDGGSPSSKGPCPAQHWEQWPRPSSSAGVAQKAFGFSSRSTRPAGLRHLHSVSVQGEEDAVGEALAHPGALPLIR